MKAILNKHETQIIELKSHLEKALKRLDFVGCKSCGGTGAIAHGDPENPDLEPCQFCWETTAAKKYLESINDGIND